MTWDDLYRSFARELLSLPRSEDQWPFDESTQREFLHLGALLEDTELNHAYECDQAIDYWLQNDHWPELSGYVLFSIRNRLDAAACLVLRIGGGPRIGPSPIPFPPQPPKDTARWLLIDWWETHGRSHAIRGWIIEQWEEIPEEDELDEP